MDGSIKSIEPIDKDIPTVVQKQTYRGNTLSASTVVTEKAAWENIFMVEVVRSCPEMCRFCLASYLTEVFNRPPSGKIHLSSRSLGTACRKYV